jgi:acetylornithine deacetylase
MDDELFYKAIDLLKAMIATPSTSRNEDAVASLIVDFLSAEGLVPQRFGNNIYIAPINPDKAKPTLLLNSHIDTVRPVDGWQRDPFTPTIEDQTLYGLGSNDAGASVVSLISAYIILNQKPQPYNLALLLSAEEEVSGNHGMEMMVSQLNGSIDLALVGEPTSMRPAIAEKGLMVLDGIVTGQAGHAARNEGINAIYRAIPVVETLRNLSFEHQSQMLGPIKISVTGIQAGTQHNVVPDCCKLMVDVRTTDAYTNLQTLEIIRQAVPDCQLAPRSTRLNPSGISPDNAIVSRASMLGLQPFGSPTLSDQALMPWPSLKIGPGDSSRSHTADEFIHLDEIREAIEIYVKLLNQVLI